MRTDCAAFASTILVAVLFPVFAHAESWDEADVAQRRADITRQEQRIGELIKLLENDRKKAPAELAPLVEPNAKQFTSARSPHISQDYFDLTNLSVVCFSREGRPVCGRNFDRR